MSRIIGIIANPSSGKDIRRIVSYGGMTTNNEKINILRRVILGIVHAGGVDEICYMPDYIKLVEEALAGMFDGEKELIRNCGIRIQPIPMHMYGVEEDSIRAAALLREMGAACVVVLGGDGTSRAVAKEIQDVPMISISTGTNNVFPLNIEGTIAGWAAGVLASGKVDCTSALVPSKRLEILNEDGSIRDIALIDAVILEEQHLGSRAMWETSEFDQIFLTTCATEYIGISSIGGRLMTIKKDEPCGLAMDIGGGQKVVAPIAPGLFKTVEIANFTKMEIGQTYPVRMTPCVIAVDGERSISVAPGSKVSIRLTWDGPRIVDTKKVLEIEREQDKG